MNANKNTINEIMNETNNDIDDNKSYYSLDTKWIDEFDVYNDLYNEDLEYINIFYFYINKENNIIDVIKTRNIIQDNKITKDELLYLIKTNIINKKKKYELMSILQYNFDINPEDVQYFLRENINNDSKCIKEQQYLIKHKSLSTIIWNQTINIFKPLNALYIVFHEAKLKKTKQNVTKKIRLSNVKLQTQTKHNKTYKKYT